MHYLLFNNEIQISDGINVQVLERNKKLCDILVSIEKVNLCVVDVDLLITSAVEYPIEKKDNILVRKFKELYHHEAYIIQDERIDNNLFQIIGIKENKVRDVYSLIPSHKIETFIPYGIALRNTLVNQRIDLKKTIVFVDDFGKERLLTVFDGLKFSRTRVVANSSEDILPEIKRSQIDFFKKTEEFFNRPGEDFVIIVNNQELAEKISRNSDKLHVECLKVAHPALEGLKVAQTSIKYTLPEDKIRQRYEIELKKRVITTFTSLCMVLVGLGYFLFNKIEIGISNNKCKLAQQTEERLEDQLKLLERQTYRSSLTSQKSLNYAVAYLSILKEIPESYIIQSFKFHRTKSWNLEMTLFVEDDGIFEPIPHIKILKNVNIKDIIVNNQPGKYMRLTL